MDTNKALREHVIALLKSGQAYDSFDEIIAEIPEGKRDMVPKNAERSVWQIVWHMRASQRDIIDFVLNTNADGGEGYVEKNWPDGYWPQSTEPENANAWNDDVQGFLADRDEFVALISKPSTDLFTRLPHGFGQTVLREALLAADHASYHCGELVVLTRMLKSI